MAPGKKITNALLALFLVVLFLPMVQQRFRLFDFHPLEGAYTPAKEPSLNKQNWFSGKFQDSAEKYMGENFGFRTVLVKAHNQVEYQLFENTNVNGVYTGKDEYLYDINYLRAWRGDNFVGTRALKQQALEMKTLQDSLAKRGITFLFVLAPSKAYYFPQYLPDDYAQEGKVTNYKMFTALADSMDINMIDFNAYFMTHRDSKYPLYPKAGVHWSRYGSTIAADSIITWLEKKRSADLPSLRMNGVKLSTSPGDPDNDMGKAMNLFFPIRSLEMAYPQYTFEDTAGRSRPSMLAIGDSYFWSLWDMGLRDNVFSRIDFWYYNNLASHSDGRPQEGLEGVDRQKEAHKYDVVLLIVTDTNVGQAGWGFLAAATKPVNQAERAQKIKDMEASIRDSPEWLEQVRKKAIQKNITLDEAVHMDAVFMVDNGG